MRKLHIWVLGVIIMLITSCENVANIRLGFDSRIEENSNGLVIAHITKSCETMQLVGLINVLHGEVIITLTNPNNETIYVKTITAPMKLRINETFVTSNGYWKLKYESKKGSGELNLHLYKE